MKVKKSFFLILLLSVLLAGCGSSDISLYRPKIVQEVKVDCENESIIRMDKVLLDTTHQNINQEDVAQEAMEIPNAYEDIINQVYEFITADSDEREEDSIIGWGLVEAYRECSSIEERLSCIGYSLYDMDGNEIPELMIIENKSYDDRILCMYTLDKDKPVLLAEGWFRKIIFLLEDNAIYQEGYNGAAYTSFSIWHIAEDGISLAVDDYYFSDFLNGSEDAESWSWFYNNTGEYDVAVSEAVEFEDVNEGFELMEEYKARKKKVDAIFYSDYVEKK